MTVAPQNPSEPGIAIVDSSRWALWFRRAWWSNRLLIYMLLLPAVTAVGVLLGYPFPIVADRADVLMRPTFLYGLLAVVVVAIAFRHIGRTAFHAAPVYALLWLTYLVIIVLGPLLGSECIRDRTSAACSSVTWGMAGEHAIWTALSVWFVVIWVIIASATFRAPIGGGRVELFLTVLEGKGDRDLVSRIRPTVLVGISMLPVLGLLALLHGQVYPELQRLLFPATKIDEEIGLTNDRGLIQLLVLAAYTNYGAAPFAMAVLPVIIDAALLVVGYRFARRTALALSGRFWTADRAPNILLLRSFSDDLVSVRPTSIFKRLGMVKMRLEEALGRVLLQRGTLIAIGQPGERLPKLGAYRLYLDDESWQPTVLGYMNSSAFVVVIGGTTKWVRWELEQIINSPNRSKLIYVLPPAELAQRLVRLELLSDALGLSLSERSVIEEHADRILAISTLKDGRVCLCTGFPRHESDFQIAAYIAMLAKGIRHD